MSKPRIISFYLPQFYPTLENNLWWGEGFTEWTNVGKAKPLFWGHYQPKVPADLGYYDLRVEATRLKQAEMAKDAGIEGFCYWHYWFSGRRLLEKIFNDVLISGSPDYPFCLCWANHTWKAKTWKDDGLDKVLMEQTYSGEKDYIEHYKTVLPAFKDRRYIKINNKPVFGVYQPLDDPNIEKFISLWNTMAQSDGFEGIHFVAYLYKSNEIDKCLNVGYNAVTIDYLLESFQDRNPILKAFQRLQRHLFSVPKRMSYSRYVQYRLSRFDLNNNVYPCILPNFDHSPRSKERAQVLLDSTPDKWKSFLDQSFSILKKKHLSEENILFIKAWNEWAEGNYLEPDLKYGRGYLDAIKEALNDKKM